MRNRREIWRDFMGRFEPSADPRDAVERGFYVPRPGRSLAEQLASRFEVKPAASHLLVGGTGSGKTTQLLVARDRLEAAGDVCAIYIDVSLQAKPDWITSTDVLAVIGIALATRLPGDKAGPEVRSSVTLFKEYLTDERTWDQDTFGIFIEEIRGILERLGSLYPHVVVLVDALDRMTNLTRFATIVDSVVVALRSTGVGVILVGPLASLYGIQRVAMDQFDRVWHLPAVDVHHDGEGLEFLLRLLRARDPDGLLTESAAEHLARISGGVLRDLVALAQVAGEEAYVDGADHVEMRHVEIASDLFGRKHIFGLDSEELSVLQRVRTQGTFVQTSEKDLALLSTRRVLEYSNGKPRFSVHPTIEPLLAQLAKVP